MTIIQTINEMQTLSKKWRRKGKTIALVPTMGYLHRGHASLIATAGEKGDIVVVSIFVNPTQFAPNEDLDAYPRDFSRDKELCFPLGVAVIFAPTPDEMYPQGFSTWVTERTVR